MAKVSDEERLERMDRTITSSHVAGARAGGIALAAYAGFHMIASKMWPAYINTNFRLKLLLSTGLVVCTATIAAENAHLELMSAIHDADDARRWEHDEALRNAKGTVGSRAAAAAAAAPTSTMK